MSLHTDTLAEASANLERSKKISWFPSVGSDKITEKQISSLIQTREDDRNQATNLRAAEDSNRRVATSYQHMAPLDSSLRNTNSNSSNKNEIEISSSAAAAATKNSDDVLSVYPPPPKSSYDPLHADSSAFRWTPAPSDFFPNTKTMIDSRKGALQQFKQLCYFTLLRKRVETRLQTLQRERGFHQNQQQKDLNGTLTSNNNNNTSASPVTSSASKKKSDKKAEFVILGDVYDPLPNPATISTFSLSRELKVQVERKLNEEAAKLEGRLLETANNNNSTNVNNNTSSSATTGNNKNTRSTSSKSTGGGRTQSNDGSKNKKQDAKNSKQHQIDQENEKNRLLLQQQLQNNNSGDDGNNSRGARTATFSVSSNLQLLQPLKIADLEVHPEMTLREPFAFKAQRFPHLPFPKHDYIVAGPKNVLLNFPAGVNEVSEAPLTNPSQTVLQSLGENSQFSAAVTALQQQQQQGGGGNLNASMRNNNPNQKRSSSGNNNKDKNNNNNNRPSSSSGITLNTKRTRSPTISGNNNTTSLSARNVPSSFIFPQVSVETFETPSVTTSHKIPSGGPLALSNGVGPLSGVTDFPAGHYTRVASAPLEAAKASPVPPRHKQLNLGTMGFFFSSLPKTLTEKQQEDDLSDDEDHDLLGMNENDSSDQRRATTTASPSSGAATFLTTPPLSLDEDAVAKLFVPTSIKYTAASFSTRKDNKEQNKSNVIQGGGARPGSSSSTGHQQQQRRPQSPSSNTNEQQQQQNQPSSQTKDANERLLWTSQPVHNEDASDVNEHVQEVLKNSNQEAEQRRKMVPSFLQHLV